jgi:hypothetical protein
MAMSVAGILSSSLFNYVNQSSQNKTQGSQNNTSQFQQQFQQLGNDLQSGSLSTAQADLAKLRPQSSLTASSQSGNPLTQEFNQLSQDIQSGNTSAAKQDYATIQQNLQNQAQVHHGHFHLGGTEASSAGETGTSASIQLLDQIGQALQSGNLSAAQQAYNNLQQVPGLG